MRLSRRSLSRLALALLVLVAELAGRSLTHRIDVGRHVATPGYANADYYPVLLAIVKVGIALLAARLVWRFASARRVASLLGTPRMRFQLSPRLWLACFLGTASVYLVHADVEAGAFSGRWPLLAPWLHSSALPVFAVLAVVLAVLFRAVERWLGDVERLAADALAFLRRLAVPPAALSHERPVDGGLAPRRLHGLAFESRPPPLSV